ncbi:serine protease [Streptomyces sp. MRC013]|uniref:serine protease n=1 Tax=Streptomyces sp. MRC013 TaxID=2898276 RepID=UPI002025E631|nr:serine protease [Streptomyces sp. MRC013]URM89416.1 serine protease [Streptomyces sp. MRC013]
MGRQDRATPVRICDRTGRTRGAGFVADHLGTVVTSHETVGDLGHIVVRAPDGSGCEVTADAVTALPADALALVRTDGLGVRPLPIADRPAPPAGAYVHVHAHGWREARVLGTARAAHPTAEGLHPVGEALELAIGTDGREALEHGGAAGGPVLDAATGAVLAVLAGSLRTDHRAAGLALPLARAAARVPGGPLAALLRRNAATVPAHGADLNLAGALRLARLTHPAVHPARTVARPAVARLLDLFAASAPAPGRPLVCGLVGEPGSGRTTVLAALADRRAAGTAPEPVLWLRGVDLRRGDTSLGDAVGRALDRAHRAAAAAGETRGARPQARAEAPDAPARHAARVAGDAGRPLLVLLDGPEEAPPSFAEGLPGWTSRTVDWLRRHGVRLALACGPAYWEAAGALYPPDVLYGDGAPAGGSRPPCGSGT